MTYKQWDVVVVPFPFVDRPKAKPRPVVLISKDEFVDQTGFFIASMVTSSLHTPLAADTTITDIKGAGLKKKSIIRLKLFSLDQRLIAKTIGRLNQQDRSCFMENFLKYLG